MIYCNKETRPNIGATTISGVQELLPDNHWYQQGLSKACSSREEAIAQNISGAVYFWENGTLYEAHSIGSWEFVPLEKEPSVVSGINWNDAYFFTKEAAEEYFSVYTGRWDNPIYEETYDVWRVHYHIAPPREEGTLAPCEAKTSGIKRMKFT